MRPRHHDLIVVVLADKNEALRGHRALKSALALVQQLLRGVAEQRLLMHLDRRLPPAEPRCAGIGEARRALRARASRKNMRNSLSGREAAFAPGAQAARCRRKFIYERLRLLPSDSVALLPQSSAIQLSGKSQTFALRTVLTWTSALRRRPTPSRWGNRSDFSMVLACRTLCFPY